MTRIALCVVVFAACGSPRARDVRLPDTASGPVAGQPIPGQPIPGQPVPGQPVPGPDDVRNPDTGRPAAARGSVVRWIPLPKDRVLLAARLGGDREMPCVVTRTGEVACWGRIQPGSDGPPDQRFGAATPLLLDGVRDVTAVSVFWFYLCVAQRAGPGGCYPLHDVQQPTPQFPQPPVEYARFQYQLCARMRDGNVGCLDTKGVYTAVPNIAHATAFTCVPSGYACCALTPTGARCFGDQGAKLGFAASTPAASVPLQHALPPATELAFHAGAACARTATGGAHCWGDAAKLSVGSGVRRVVATADDVCLILDEGTLTCADERTPRAPDLVDAVEHCRVHRDGSVRCRGTNSNGELGEGKPLLSIAPVRVGAIDDAIDLRVAHNTSCALRRGGGLWCWGGAPLDDVNRYGARGALIPGQYVAGCRIAPPADLECTYPDLGHTWTKQTIDAKGGAATIATAAVDRDSSVCVVDGTGKIACRFGMADNGMSPRWTPLQTPARVAELQPISTGFCARLVDGRVSCFVDDRYDDDPDYLDKLPAATMKLVPGITGAVQLSTGQSDACAINTKAEVWCWRLDTARSVPRELPTLRGATWVAGNDHHRCAIVRGDVWCWGPNHRGELGNGTPTASSIDRIVVPVRAALPVQATRVGVGGESTCALDTTGRVWCWGGNRYDQLGQGRTLFADTPQRVVGLGPR